MEVGEESKKVSYLTQKFLLLEIKGIVKLGGQQKIKLDKVNNLWYTVYTDSESQNTKRKER